MNSTRHCIAACAAMAFAVFGGLSTAADPPRPGGPKKKSVPKKKS